jgi:hypothetical protein
MSCPYTSQQNGKAERSLRTLTNIMRCLLFQASLPPAYWVEGLHTTTYLVNLLPTKTLASSTPYSALFSSEPSYDHFKVFGCAGYPNMSSTSPHKLARLLLNHKGYRCCRMDLPGPTTSVGTGTD